MNKFWETAEWIKLKTDTLKTEKLLTRAEYLREVGYKDYSEEKYKRYLEIMSTINFDNPQRGK